MNPSRELESAAGRRAVERAAHEHWLLAFDFDGTLAPFVTDPLAAAMPTTVYRDLDQLARRRSVAIITGRSRRDVLPRVPPSIAYVVGNHGGESPTGDQSNLLAAQATVDLWRTALLPLIAESGLRLECKGPSLALHWRGHPHADVAAAVAAHSAMRLTPRPRLVAGDHVLNLIPADLPDKGTALLNLLHVSGCPGALFVGDDITDAAVFRLRDPGILGIEVGDKQLGADWHLKTIAGVAGLVAQLVTLTTPG